MADAPSTAVQRPRLTPGIVAVLGAMNLIDCINVNLLVPYVDRMISGFLGRDTDDPHVVQTVGILIGLYSFCEVVFSPFWGFLSDRVGRRPILLVGLGGSALAPFLFGMASSLPMAFAARALDGFFCGNIGVTKTYLGELVDESNEARGFSFLAVCFSLGLLIGPALGGALVFPARWAPGLFGGTVFDRFPFLLPNAIYGTLAVAAWVLGVVCLPETLPRELRRERAAAAATGANQAAAALLEGGEPGSATSAARVSQRSRCSPLSCIPKLKWPPRLVRVVMSYCLVSGFQASWVQNFILITSLPRSDDGFALQPAQIGLLQNAAAVGLLLTQLLLYPRAIKRFGFRRCIGFGYALTLGFTTLFPVYGLFAGRTSWGIWRLSPLMLFQFFSQIGAGFVFPTSFASINRFARGMDLGTVNGLANSLGALSRALLPPLGASLLSLGLWSGVSLGRYLGVLGDLLVGLSAWSLMHHALGEDGIGMVRKPEVRDPEAIPGANSAGVAAAAP